MAPQTWMLAASISRLENPMPASRSNVGETRSSALMPSWSRQNSSPIVHLLKANLMSKAVGSALSTLAMASSVKPLAFKVVWLMAVAWASDCLLYTSDAADDLTRVDLGG